MEKEEKQALRQTLLSKQTNRDPVQKKQFDLSIAERLLKTSVYQKARTVFIYYSTPNEIDTHGIIEQALREKKRVCIPKIVQKGIMEARQIKDLNQDIQPGAFDIPEPNDTTKIIRPEEMDLAIVPCLACDLHGYRLGYGGGYYDRYLSDQHVIKMALCYDSHVFEALPHEIFDVAMQGIVCETAAIKTCQ